MDRVQEAKRRRERLRWIRKARELEPDHVDAALAEIEMTAKNPYEEEMLLFELQQKAEKQLRERGDFGKEASATSGFLLERARICGFVMRMWKPCW